MKIMYTINLPVAADELGRWLEDNGACIDIRCSLGKYHITISRRKILSCSDEDGRHSETREVTRFDKNMMVALEAALRAAGAIDP